MNEMPSQPAEFSQATSSLWCDGGKRAVDLIVATALLALIAPALLMISFLVRLDGGPALFRHRRIGRGGHSFLCLKFRTMRVDAEQILHDLLDRDPEARKEWDRDFKLRDDPRITRLGRILRRTSIDELPQLINVLKGEMSLVGPRPIVEAEIPRYGGAITFYLRCRPGITGLWQVTGRNNTSYTERVTLDVEYERDISVWRDCHILAKTVIIVLTRNGAY